MKSKVAIVKGTITGLGENIEEMVERSLSLIGGIEQVIRPGDKVLLKPNLTTVWPGVHEGIITDARIVRSAIRLAYEAKAGEVIIGEGSGAADTEEAYEISGIKGVAREFGARLIDFNKAEAVEVPIPEGRVLKKTLIAKEALESDVIVNLPVMKTTADPVVVTIGLKNMMGLLPGKGIFKARYFTPEYVESLPRGGLWEATGGKKIVHDAGNLHKAIIDLNTLVKADLTIVDGIVGLEAGGPTTGDPIRMDLIITGTDPVAVDAVTAAVMGFNPTKIKYLVYAAKRGLGTCDLNEIEIVGKRIEDVRKKFRKPPTPERR